MSGTIETYPARNSSDASCVNFFTLENRIDQVYQPLFGECETGRLSPTICLLDHQEIVESDKIPPDKSSTSPEGAGSLFSFEVDANEIPQAVLDTVDDLLTDFGWNDILTDSSDQFDQFLSSFGNEESSINTSTWTDSAQVGSLQDSDLNCDTRPPLYPLEITSNKKSSFSQGGDAIASKLSNAKHFSILPDVNADSNSETSSADSSYSPQSHGYLNNEDLVRGTPGTRLFLTTEERKLLKSMGVNPPSRFPLTRTEEKALRTVRRKIRNKLSAQASRLRRQKYVAELEHRVKLREKENTQLRQQVATLESDKRSLMTHVKKLRSYVNKLLSRDNHSTPLPLYIRSKHNDRYSATSAQTATAAAGGTSLLVFTFLFLAWTALVPGPTQKLSRTGATSVGIQSNPFWNVFPGRSRALLESDTSKLFGSNSPAGQTNRPAVSTPKQTVETKAPIEDVHRLEIKSASAAVLEASDLLQFQGLSIESNDSSSPSGIESRSDPLMVQNVISSIDL